MYVTDPRGSVYALDAADGHLLWTFDVTELIGGGAKAGYVFRNRGVCYADGVVYTAAGSFLFALDAKTGKPIQTFGKNGQASVILDVIKERYPDVKAAISARLLVHDRAADSQRRASTSAARAARATFPAATCWRSTPRPARCSGTSTPFRRTRSDQGWDIAGPTWVGGERNGGGIWETPSIDPELGLLYVAVGNPFGDSTKRVGTNLFTDSILALSLDTGTLKWHYQQTHHDVWDYDSGNQPILFDMQVRGQRVKALAEASKNGYLYILNRETGQPVHPIKEMPVPTETDAARRAAVADAADSVHGGRASRWSRCRRCFRSTCRPSGSRRASWCRCSRRRARTRSTRRAPRAARTTVRSPTVRAPGCSTSTPSTARSTPDVRRSGYFSAFDPTTGELAWQQTFDGWGQAGSVVTAGGLVFVGTGSNTAGYFFAYDAKTGELLWKFNTGAGVFSSPSVYMVNGEEFVTVGVGRRRARPARRRSDSRFALPKRSR